MKKNDMKKSIILVEDDQDLAQLTNDYLDSHGYNVEVIGDGLSAIDRIVRQQPDLVILDLMLPGVDGLEVCKRVRAKYDRPILMFTARNDSIDEILGLEMGADDYIKKPVEPRLLAARIKALLRRTLLKQAEPLGHDNQVEIDGLRINNRSRTVYLNDQIIELTTPEYELLWLLMSNAGKILSRDFIFENLRGVGYDGLNRTIDINVSRLRSKLSDNSSSPERIKTVRNKGYLLSI